MEEDSPIFKKPNRVFLEEYTEYFASVRSSLNIEELLRKFPTKDITYNPNSTFEGVRVEPVSVERRGAVVRFRVDIGGFTLIMVVINVDDRASKICRGRLYENPEQSVVIQERMTMQASLCVSKRTGFMEINDMTEEVKEVVKECAFAKLCAALGIGVPVGSPDHPFDLVCYEDCMEFFMEKCRPVKRSLDLPLV